MHIVGQALLTRSAHVYVLLPRFGREIPSVAETANVTRGLLHKVVHVLDVANGELVF